MVYRDKSDKFHLKFQTLLAVAIDPLGSELLLHRARSERRQTLMATATTPSRASTPTSAVCSNHYSSRTLMAIAIYSFESIYSVEVGLSPASPSGL